MITQNNFPNNSIQLSSFLKFCDYLSEIIIITDTEDRILFTNSSFEEHFGFLDDQIKNKKIDKLFLDEKIIETNGKKTIASMVDKEGEEFKCGIKVLSQTNAVGDIEHKVYFINDLRESIERKREERESAGKFQSLFREIKDGLYESTPDGKLIDMNPAGVELFGYKSKQELLKTNIAEDLYLNPYDRTKFKNQLEKDGYVKDYEIGVRRKDGTIVTVLETAFAVRDKDGTIKSYRGILRDITAAKNYEAKLRKYIEELGQVNKKLIKSEEELKELNAAKDKFFSIVAHDLRSPFTSLIGYSEFLRDDFEELSDEEIKLFANNIHESAHVVFNLLENLLQWSRVQTGRINIEPEILDISSLVNSTINLLKNNAERKSISLVNDILPRTLVYADQQTISSVVQNLLSNAIKFTPRDGKIEIGCNLKKTTAEIFVADTGVGIKEEDKEKLFRIDTHLTTTGTDKEKGTGLGLILCKELVEKNHGKIWVESKLGKGSTFTFSLPTQG